MLGGHDVFEEVVHAVGADEGGEGGVEVFEGFAVVFFGVGGEQCDELEGEMADVAGLEEYLGGELGVLIDFQKGGVGCGIFEQFEVGAVAHEGLQRYGHFQKFFDGFRHRVILGYSMGLTKRERGLIEKGKIHAEAEALRRRGKPQNQHGCTQLRMLASHVQWLDSSPIRSLTVAVLIGAPANL